MRQIFPLEFPFTPGGDFSGTVDTLGAGVDGIRIGEDVYGYAMAGGTYAEFIALDADKVAPKPRTLSHAEADAKTLAALERVGMTEAAGRKIAGYSKGMRQRIKLAQAIGAITIDDAKESPVERIMDITKGEGADCAQGHPQRAASRDGRRRPQIRDRHVRHRLRAVPH